MLIFTNQSVHQDGMHGKIAHCILGTYPLVSFGSPHVFALLSTCKMSLDTAVAALGYKAPALK